MRIGRADGPRLELCRAGVRLIGFATWPEERRLSRDGRPLRRSYAERVDAAARQNSVSQRLRVFTWDEVLRVELKVEAKPASTVVGFLKSRRVRTVTVGLLGLIGNGFDGVGGGGGAASTPWDAPPRSGTATALLTSPSGVWTATLPLDTDDLLVPGAADVVRRELRAVLDSPVLRAHLPPDWPTGAFWPGEGS